MAITWHWSEQIGTWSFKDAITNNTIKTNLYKGNAYLISIHEYKKEGHDVYDVVNFWVDKDHMKNCLGLNKNTNFIYDNWKENNITIYKDMITPKHLNEIISNLIKGFDEITINIKRKEKTK